jgi:hypothetical protein
MWSLHRPEILADFWAMQARNGQIGLIWPPPGFCRTLNVGWTRFSSPRLCGESLVFSQPSLSFT